MGVLQYCYLLESNGGIALWNVFRLWKPETFARAQRTAAAASARLPASPLARLLAVLRTSSARSAARKRKLHGHKKVAARLPRRPSGDFFGLPQDIIFT